MRKPWTCAGKLSAFLLIFCSVSSIFSTLAVSVKSVSGPDFRLKYKRAAAENPHLLANANVTSDLHSISNGRNDNSVIESNFYNNEEEETHQEAIETNDEKISTLALTPGENEEEEADGNENTNENEADDDEENNEEDEELEGISFSLEGQEKYLPVENVMREIFVDEFGSEDEEEPYYIHRNLERNTPHFSPLLANQLMGLGMGRHAIAQNGSNSNINSRAIRSSSIVGKSSEGAANNGEFVSTEEEDETLEDEEEESEGRDLKSGGKKKSNENNGGGGRYNKGKGKKGGGKKKKNNIKEREQDEAVINVAKYNEYIDAVLKRMNSLIRGKRMDPLKVNLFSSSAPSQNNNNDHNNNKRKGQKKHGQGQGQNNHNNKNKKNKRPRIDIEIGSEEFYDDVDDGMDEEEFKNNSPAAAETEIRRRRARSKSNASIESNQDENISSSSSVEAKKDAKKDETEKRDLNESFAVDASVATPIATSPPPPPLSANFNNQSLETGKESNGNGNKSSEKRPHGPKKNNKKNGNNNRHQGGHLNDNKKKKGLKNHNRGNKKNVNSNEGGGGPKPIRGYLNGLSTLKRFGDVFVTKQGKKTRIVTARFILGPVSLEIMPKKANNNKMRNIKSKETSEENLNLEDDDEDEEEDDEGGSLRSGSRVKSHNRRDERSEGHFNNKKRKNRNKSSSPNSSNNNSTNGGNSEKGQKVTPVTKATAPLLRGILEVRLKQGNPTKIRKLRVFPPKKVKVEENRESYITPLRRPSGSSGSGSKYGNKVSPMATSRLRQIAIQVLELADINQMNKHNKENNNNKGGSGRKQRKKNQKKNLEID